MSTGEAEAFFEVSFPAAATTHRRAWGTYIKEVQFERMSFSLNQ
jgi:hypothetical protein